MVPLQSLSLPSQVSALGALEPVQTLTPPEQEIAPAVHSPTQFATRPPGQLVPHAMPTSVGALSTRPSQSSSTPLHNSFGDGPTPCVQVSPFGPPPGEAPLHTYVAVHLPLVKMPPP